MSATELEVVSTRTPRVGPDKRRVSAEATLDQVKGGDTPPEPPVVRWWSRVPVGVVAAVLYLLGGVWVAGRLWVAPHGRVLSSFSPDQYQFEFWLTHVARIFTHGEVPFFTSQLNFPVGVNMMANTAMFGMSIPLTPVTLLFGPQVSFALVVTLAPAMTAFAWYMLFSRKVVRSRVAALVAAAFCGFAPGIAAQDNVHPNLALQWVLPLLVWQVLRVADRSVPAWKPGVLLGLLAAYQLFINEELLLITALSCGIFVASWAALNRAAARALVRRLLAVLGIAAGLGGVLVAYPVWYQFAGPESYRGFASLARLFGVDVTSFTAMPTHSLASGPDSATIANNVVEETTFLGWPLVVMSCVWVRILWRRTVVRASLILAVFLIVGSLGSYIHFAGRMRHIPAPWYLLGQLPLLDSVIPNRLALGLIPIVALLIALVLDDLMAMPKDRSSRQLRRLGYAGVALALVPIAPTPFSAVSRMPVPAFVTEGLWRSYVPAGHGMLMLPVPTGSIGISALQWSVAAGGDIPVIGGYFLAPDPDKADHEAIAGPQQRPTLLIFRRLVETGKVTVIGPAQRADAVTDLRAWRASVVVLPPNSPYADPMRTLMTSLVQAPPQLVGGVWVWDVRSIVDQ